MAPDHSWKSCRLAGIVRGVDSLPPAARGEMTQAISDVDKDITDRQRRYLHLHVCVGLQDSETTRILEEVHQALARHVMISRSRGCLRAIGIPGYIADGPLPEWLLTPGKVKVVTPIEHAGPDHLVPEIIRLSRRIVRCHTCTVDCWETPTMEHRDAEIICFLCLRTRLRREYENAKGIHRS